MSGHFLRPPNMLTKFSETPQNYVDQFFLKIAFYWQQCIETLFSQETPTHLQKSSFSQENK